MVGGLKGCWHIKGVPSGQAHGKCFDLLITAIHLGSSLRQKEHPEGAASEGKPLAQLWLFSVGSRDPRQLRQARGPEPQPGPS